MIPIINFDTDTVPVRKIAAWPNIVRMGIFGPSGAGKTNILLTFLTYRQPVFQNIYICSKTIYQTKYELLQDLINEYNNEKKNKKNPVTFHAVDVENIPDPESIEKGSIIIFDDVLTEKQDRIANFFLRGRHRQISCVYISQSFTRLDKKNCIRSNLNYLILLKQDGVNLRQLFNEFVTDMSWECFKQLASYAWSAPFNFFTIDLEADKAFRYKKNFDELTMMKNIGKSHRV